MNKRRLWNGALFLVAALWISMGMSKLFCGWSSVFSYRAFYILSESMEPVIHEHQIVFGKLAGDGSLAVGEIYAYQGEGPWGREMVIHRLVEITEDGAYIFQGDNNDAPDEAVGREQIGYHIVGISGCDKWHQPVF